MTDLPTGLRVRSLMAVTSIHDPTMGPGKAPPPMHVAQQMQSVLGQLFHQVCQPSPAPIPARHASPSPCPCFALSHLHCMRISPVRNAATHTHRRATPRGVVARPRSRGLQFVRRPAPEPRPNRRTTPSHSPCSARRTAAHPSHRPHLLFFWQGRPTRPPRCDIHPIS
jgi:hypothetical protein